jgi:hypothetical protein
LFSDTKMTSIKGQLSKLPPQAALQCLYGQNGYLFPRNDHVVIGGTFEVGVNSETPDKALCRSLVDHIRAQFGKGRTKRMPDLHIHHPDHAPIVNPAIPVARDFASGGAAPSKPPSHPRSTLSGQ